MREPVIPDEYTAWRRSDGYVSASAGFAKMTGHYGTNADGSATTFEVLEQGTWAVVRDRIEAERAADPMAAGWWTLPNAAELEAEYDQKREIIEAERAAYREAASR